MFVVLYLLLRCFFLLVEGIDIILLILCNVWLVFVL